MPGPVDRIGVPLLNETDRAMANTVKTDWQVVRWLTLDSGQDPFSGRHFVSHDIPSPLAQVFVVNYQIAIVCMEPSMIE
jgi:hypothetical protein